MPALQLDVLQAVRRGEVVNPECVCPKCGAPKVKTADTCRSCCDLTANFGK